MIPMLAVALLAACKQSPDPAKNADTQQQEAVEVTFAGFKDTVKLDLVKPDKAQRESYFDRKAKSGGTTQARSATATQAGAATTATARQKGKAETIYVEAEGARGRVWGHVTMKGDRGTGTVHDEGENTWAVSVTRHGNELYAVDQNSRQYVFKLKNK